MSKPVTAQEAMRVAVASMVNDPEPDAHFTSSWVDATASGLLTSLDGQGFRVMSVDSLARALHDARCCGDEDPTDDEKVWAKVMASYYDDRPNT